MAEKSILIIGGGVAGLSAGIYARMNGLRAEVLEMHTKPGGLCTAWQRKGYTFDGCLHWLTGSSPKSSMYRIWQEMGVVQGRTFINSDYFTQAVDEAGNRLIVYADPARLHEQMLAISPGDERLITTITRAIERLSRWDMPIDFTLGGLFKMIPMIVFMFRYRMSTADLAKRFTSPVLRDLFIQALGWHTMSIGFIFWSLSLMHKGDGGYAIGGSQPIADAMAKRLQTLGGRIRYRAPVEKILVEANRAVGVRLKSGEELRADYVISAADGHATIFDLLGGRYVNPAIQRYYDELDPFPPLVYVSLGVKGNYSAEPHSLSFPLKKSFAIGPDEVKRLGIRIYNFDPTMAPKGKTVIIAMIETTWAYWEAMGRTSAKYRAEKERIGAAVVAGIAERLPAIKKQVEVIDVATPLTFVRYTGNWRGSYEGFLLNRKSLGVRPSQTLPGLANFWMAGQWVSPGGGLPAGPLTARNALLQICHTEKRKFVATVFPSSP